MTTASHCPYRQSTLLQQALAPDKMRIAFLLGAGCPVALRVTNDKGEDGPLIPDIKGLTSLVGAELKKDKAQSGSYDKLLARFAGEEQEPTIESVLTHLRSLADVVRSGKIDGLDRDALNSLDTAICNITTKVVGVSLPSGVTPYHQLAMWIGNVGRAKAVEVFTPNYDILVEQSFEARKVPYFDGFVGAKQAFFDLTAMESDVLPARWARVWKLHGSINWWRTSADEVVRKEGKDSGDRQMIYPSHLKYDQSRRMPYLAMLDRLREFLGKGQAVLVTCGYSFADQHLNELITTGLRGNPTAVCFGLLYGPRASYPEAVGKAKLHPNLTLLARDGAVLGAVERDWHSEDLSGHPLHGTCVYKKASAADEPENNCQFLLGDFGKLGAFLAQQLARMETADVTTAE